MEKTERNLDNDRKIIVDYYRAEAEYEKALEIESKAFRQWRNVDAKECAHPEQNNNCIELYAKYVEARRNLKHFRDHYISLKSLFDEVMKFYEVN
ncbi:MAG: hypothetical protein IKE95_08315 [Methanobrevibacter sp.]|nr:hypothetical protein [Methanobrevibacter sp.]